MAIILLVSTGTSLPRYHSEKTNSRTNAPINVVVGALILKDFTNLTYEEITEACEFDFRYQYALHTTSFEDQPVSERSLSRFRSRLAAYELTTREDLLHQCFVEMAESMRNIWRYRLPSNGWTV